MFLSAGACITTAIAAAYVLLHQRWRSEAIAARSCQAQTKTCTSTSFSTLYTQLVAIHCTILRYSKVFFVLLAALREDCTEVTVLYHTVLQHTVYMKQ
jgi:hypothetical protein